MELIGKANLRTVGLFQKRAKSQAPFLHQSYPASSVVRACPPPQTTRPAPHGVPVESHDLSPLGLPVLRSIFVYMHADATTPARSVGAFVASSPHDGGLPRKTAGSALANRSFEACSAFTHVSACMLAKSPKVTRSIEVLRRHCHLRRRSDCYRLERPVAGWDSHPLKIDAFARHTRKYTLIGQRHFCRK